MSDYLMNNESPYADLIEVVHCDDGSYRAKAIAKRHFAAGEVIAKIENEEKIRTPMYLSVQFGVDDHRMLNTEFEFMNHSCDPNVNVDTGRMVYFAAKEILPGEEMRWFYPSTEWTMDRSFPCWCGYEKCFKEICGAKELNIAQLSGYFINRHILELYRSGLGERIRDSNHD